MESSQDRYRRKNPAKVKASFRKWYLKNQEQQKAKALAWRANNLEYSRKYHRAYMKEIANALAAIKLKRGCIDCGYNKHPAALDFDHVTGKTFTVAQAPSLAKALKEIEKCEVRCANCHRVKTVERRKAKITIQIEKPELPLFRVGV